MAATLADLTRHLKSSGRDLPTLILMTDPVRLPDPLEAVSRLPRGAAVILRHYDDPARETLARSLMKVCRERRVDLLVAGDPRLALRVGADGVHFPEHGARRISGCGAWRRPRARFLVTVAAHSAPALAAAARLGADAALLSPVFATPSHPGVPVLGPVRFAALVRSSPVPVYALGGISPTTARKLAGSGAAGFAGIGAIGR